MRKPAKKAADAVTTLKAAIYIRVSTQYQVDRASLPVQREELINYAKYALDITDCVVFEDAGYFRQEYRPAGLPAHDGPCPHSGVFPSAGLED